MRLHVPYGLMLLVLLSACAASTPPVNGKQVPSSTSKSTIRDLAKGDLDRMADIEVRENIQSLRTIMTKLYKRNPQYLKLSTSGSVEDMVAWVFDGNHQWRFESINGKQDVESIYLAFNPNFQGDRVLAFIVGLQTMLLKAHDLKTDFYLTDSLDPQRLYNLSRNIEIAVWMLETKQDESGRLFLLSNHLSTHDSNLSFEREFGKMIGRTDDYAILLADKTQRTLSRVSQSLATAVFLPF